MEKEYHVHLTCDLRSLQLDGLPAGEKDQFPENIRQSVRAIHALLEAHIPGLTYICIMGIWTPGASPVFCAFDLWIQTGEAGWYLPMRYAAALFRDNGLPYFHLPPVVS